MCSMASALGFRWTPADLEDSAGLGRAILHANFGAD